MDGVNRKFSTDSLTPLAFRKGFRFDTGMAEPARIPEWSLGERMAKARSWARAGVTGHRPHDLRATFATALIREGIDLVTVQSYLGHASVATTQRYVLPNDEGVALVNRLSFAA